MRSAIVVISSNLRQCQRSLIRRGIPRVFPQHGFVLLTTVKRADDANLLGVDLENRHLRQSGHVVVPR